jgi:hypothetical protein
MLMPAIVTLKIQAAILEIRYFLSCFIALPFLTAIGLVETHALLRGFSGLHDAFFVQTWSGTGSSTDCYPKQLLLMCYGDNSSVSSGAVRDFSTDLEVL